MGYYDIKNATFYGDGRDGENAGEFIDRISRHFLLHSDTISDDNTRIQILKTLFPRHSQSRRWIDKVTTDITNPVTTWDSTHTVLGLRDVFELEWPDVTPVEKRPHERRAELLEKATELTEGNMTSWVLVGGMKQMLIRVWVNAVIRLAHQIPDIAGLCIDDVRDRMPRSLRSHLVRITTTSWMEFRQAVDNLNLEQLLFLQAEDVRLARFEEENATLRSLDAALKAIPASQPVPRAFPPQILQDAQISSIGTYRPFLPMTTSLHPVDDTPVLQHDVKVPYILATSTSPSLPVIYSSTDEFHTMHSVYTVESEAERSKISVPYLQKVMLEGPKGENVRLTAVFDDGSMVGALDSAVFRRVAHRLGSLHPSLRWLRMANGVRVRSKGVWEGKVTVGGVVRRGAFEVFDGGGSWDMLFGKPLLRAFNAVHEYTTDTITVSSEVEKVTLGNDTLPADSKPVGESLVFNNTESPASLKGLPEVRDPSRRETRRVSNDEIERENTDKIVFQDWSHLACAPIGTEGQQGGEEAYSDWESVRFRCEDDDKGLLHSPCANFIGDSHSPTREVSHAAESARISSDTESRNSTEAQTRGSELEGNLEQVGARNLGKSESMDSTCANFIGDSHSPTREVSLPVSHVPELDLADTMPHPDPSISCKRRSQEERTAWRLSQGLSARKGRGGRRLAKQVMETIRMGGNQVVDDVDEDEANSDEIETSAVHVVQDAPNVFTRRTDPFNSGRVDAVLRAITIGTDLTSEERERVENTIRSYADCFALSMAEVLVVDNAEFTVKIPEGAVFKRRIGQRRMSPPAKSWFNAKLDEMVDAGIVASIPAADVLCCSPITLAQKTHTDQGMPMDELLHALNDACVDAGIKSGLELPPRPEKDKETRTHTVPPPSWRIVSTFEELNKVLDTRPMPQGDIRAKQQVLCGKRYINMFDFASGFFACQTSLEAQRYLCFFVEGRGYFSWKRMPMGIEGAPTWFSEMTQRELKGLIDEIMVLFVDDGGQAGDDFDDLLQDFIRVLECVRSSKLSLSATKTALFVGEAVFAGARVGKYGIKPDLKKVAALVSWPTPVELQTVGQFLGLAGVFRSQIRGYAEIAQPLSDLLRLAEVPTSQGRTAYRAGQRRVNLPAHWTREHDRAFLRLKLALINEPVLQAPRYDGSPFIVTTDGCQKGFGGWLSQWHNTSAPSGKVTRMLHPIAYVSKRTSEAEERYKPFLLETAGLKFCLEEFDEDTYGFPIEVETDCQALRDLLTNTKLSATHARWKEAILSFWIVAVRHRPGRTNLVGDALSRKYEGQPKVDGDGHEWSVEVDWQDRHGLVNDMFTVTPAVEDFDALLARFGAEPMFVQIIESLEEIENGRSMRDKKRARHRAEGYFVDDGKLWRLATGKSTRARARLECVTQTEAIELAREEHQKHGHWSRDLVKMKLMDQVYSPRLDKSIVKALLECGRCKAFGPVHVHSLLEPVIRRHPYELWVADYLSLPKAKGGFKTVVLYVDAFAQKVWGDKFRVPGSADTTLKSLDRIVRDFPPPETLMTDNGRHLNNLHVREWCEDHGTVYFPVAAYSPWIQSLVEGSNGRLLNRLKRLCAPDLGEDGWAAITDFEGLPHNWPNHFDQALCDINERILPALKHSPNEISLGLVVNTARTQVGDAEREASFDEAAVHVAYVQQQQLDVHSHNIEHREKQKMKFDAKVLGRQPGEVVFQKGQLVQIYRSDLIFVMKTEKKLLVRWSAPYRVESRIRNSYHLVNLDGSPIRYKDGREAEGTFSSRRLRRFIPRPGTKLAEDEEGVAETEDVGDIIDDAGGEDDEEVGDEEEVNKVDIVWLSTRASPYFGGAHGLGSPGREGQGEGEVRAESSGPARYTMGMDFRGRSSRQ